MPPPFDEPMPDGGEEFQRVSMSSTVVYRFSPAVYGDINDKLVARRRLQPLAAQAQRDFEMTHTSVLGKLASRTVTRRRPAVTVSLDLSQAMFAHADHDVIHVVSGCVEDATLAVTINLCFSRATADQLVAIAHSMGGRPAEPAVLSMRIEESGSAQTARSINDLHQQIADYLGLVGRSSASSHFRCVEIRQFGNLTTAAEAMEKNVLALYGVLAGDEGWRYVSPEVAQKRFDHVWSTRDFVGIVSLGDSTLLLNFRPPAYGLAQNEFFERHFAYREPYFTNDYCVAALEHGPFMARELTAYRQCVVEDLQNRLQARRTLKLTVSLLGDVSGRARRNSLYRSLVEDLVRLRDHPPTELGALINIIEEDSELPRSLDNLRQEVQALEGEEQTLYLYRVNRILVLVAWVGVLVAVVGLIAASGVIA